MTSTKITTLKNGVNLNDECQNDDLQKRRQKIKINKTGDVDNILFFTYTFLQMHVYSQICNKYNMMPTSSKKHHVPFIHIKMNYKFK